MRPLLCVFFILCLASCSLNGAHVGAPYPSGSGANPDVLQNGEKLGHWKQFTPHTASTIYRGITAGPDGNVWFADNNGNALVRTKMTGAIKAFPLAYTENGVQIGFSPLTPAVGADGKFYITTSDADPKNNAGMIGVLSPTGAFHRVDSPSGDNPGSNGIALGPDGNVWFAEQKHIAMITPAGAIQEFLYPSGTTQNSAAGVVEGPDGKVWFDEYFAHMVAKIDPTSHAITEYDVSSAGCSGAQGLAVGSDGDLYFNCAFNAIAKITTSGAVTAISNPLGTIDTAQDLVRGSNGHIWIVGGSNAIGDYDETKGTLTAHSSPFTTNGLMINMTSASDDNLWITDNGGHLEIFALVTLKVSPASLTFTGTGQSQTITATYHGHSTLSAVSNAPSVATVAPGGGSSFVVTSQAAGKATVTVMDQIGNLFQVRVTVQ